MAATKIDITELQSKYGEEVKNLTEFLEEKLGVKAEVAGSEIVLKMGKKGEEVSKDYLRVLLRKFLHRQELKEEFRVISGKESVLTIKERRQVESE